TGSFYEKGRDGELVPREFQAWPGDHGWRSADWFDVRIEADRGDVIVLAPGMYTADVWVFAPGVTVTTDPAAEMLGQIHGTVEIDADRVTLDRIGVIGPKKDNSSGHGIEVNRELISHITIRNCRSAENEWTGIHIIGPRGTIDELRVEDCELVHNGMDGMDAQSVVNLIITGCTITDNGWDFEHGVGVRIGSFVEHVEMHDNRIWGNRLTDVYQKE
ncbi:MAG TPA: right-handed parallel beta-helix repeat-containing protein, partial [Candidatus Heimdallarchaeota archaeon]|nr:right-handed parallel beta-helix repeat-containing protein [Candidatus Heimdallarchaeota archaeon]